jgi:hypothetical protein
MSGEASKVKGEVDKKIIEVEEDISNFYLHGRMGTKGNSTMNQINYP